MLEVPAASGLVRRGSLQDNNNWRELITVRGGETVQEMVQKLFKQSGYDKERAERSMVFLDGLDHPGASTVDYGQDAKQVGKEILKEIMELINGTKFEVTKPKNLDADGKDKKVKEEVEKVTLQTGHMFFICFGVKGGDLEDEDQSEEDNEQDAVDRSDAQSNGQGKRNYLETFISCFAIFGDQKHN